MLLSRVANSIYWMSRYMERAENVARFIDVNLQLSLDEADVQAGGTLWDALIAVTGDAEEFRSRYGSATPQSVMQFLTLDRDYPNSIASSVAAARDNARTIRDIITSEMWQNINSLHHTVRKTGEDAIQQDRPVDFYRAVRDASLQFAAVTDATMSHNEGFEFSKLGRMLERADKTSRVLDVKYFLLLPEPDDVGGTLDVVQWAALLRSVGALEMYRQVHGVITPKCVAEFLILDQQFPRSMAHCLWQAQGALDQITTRQDLHTLDVSRRLGLLRSLLQFGDIEQIIQRGLHEYIDQTQQQLNQIDDAINTAFFQFTPPSQPFASQGQMQFQ
jgi:uncharacterized alpha-E superfamily protein